MLASTSSMHECAVSYYEDMEIATVRLVYIRTYHINAISVNGPTTLDNVQSSLDNCTWLGELSYHYM